MTGGWAIGYMIGTAVVVVVALVVLVIIGLARRIARQAQRATRTIADTRDHTEALWLLAETQRLLAGVLTVLAGPKQEGSGQADYEGARTAVSEQNV